MQRKVLWITVADLPQGIHGDDLLHLLEEKYPENRVLIEGFLAVFSGLPIELIQKIFAARSSVHLLSVQLNTTLRERFLETLYNSICEIPITKWEIMQEINSGKSVTFVCNEGDDCIRCYKIMLNYRDQTWSEETPPSQEDSSCVEGEESFYEEELLSTPYAIDLLAYHIRMSRKWKIGTSKLI